MGFYVWILAGVFVSILIPIEAVRWVLRAPACRDRVIATDVAMVFASICCVAVGFICAAAALAHPVAVPCSGQAGEVCYFVALISPIAFPVATLTAAGACVLGAALLPRRVLAARRRPRAMAQTLGGALAIGAALALTPAVRAAAAAIGVLDGG